MLLKQPARPNTVRVKPLPLFDLTDRITDVWALPIAELMQRQPEGYLRYFTPFAADTDNIVRVLHNAIVCLLYRSIHSQADTTLIGCWFLMDWQDNRPEFGLLIDHEYQGQGLGTLCMQMAQLTARWRGATAIRSAVWPDNIGARRINDKFGFVTTGRKAKGQIEMECAL